MAREGWPWSDWRVALLVVLLGGGMLDAQAQSGRRPQGQSPAPILRLTTLEVVVPLLAYDADGRLVDDLQPHQVLVLEEGESRPVASLKREPAHLLLLLDGANEFGTFKNGPTQRYRGKEGPIWEKRPAEASQLARPTSHTFAVELLAQLSPLDEVAVIQYSDRVRLLQDWTRDHAQAKRALESGYRIGLRSTLHDALHLAAEKLATKREGRRLVVLLSDGIDSASKVGRERALRALEAAQATVFVVGWAAALRREIELAVDWMRTHEAFNTNSARRIGELRRYLGDLEREGHELRLVAEQTGGVYHSPANHEELLATAAPLAREIGAQYSLTFITEPRPGDESRRRIEVLPARPGLSVQSRRRILAPDPDRGREP
ncbi:MAG: VWA domain-containing protein [Blastocatellia bacterium]